MGDTFRRGETIAGGCHGFDKAVRVTGQPQVALTIGTSVRNVMLQVLVPSPCHNHMSFDYTVEEGDVDD